MVRVRDAIAGRPAEILFDAVDLSQGGAFLRSDLLLEVGEEIEITFAIPGAVRPIRARARVAWATRAASAKGGAGMGLEFLNLGASDRERIADFVREVRRS